MLHWYKIFDSEDSMRERMGQGRIVRVHLSRLDMLACLVLTPQGLRAFGDQCPHSAISLARGYVNAEEEVVCPWHHYRFELKTGRNSSHNGCPDLPIYPVRTGPDGVYIGIAQKPA